MVFALSFTPYISDFVPLFPAAAKAAAETAPDAALTSLKNSSSTSISALYAEKPLYLNFWASWCPPCVGEMPHINEMFNKYGDRVNFAAVSVDYTPEEAVSFINGKGSSLSIPFYYGDSQAIAQAYNLSAIPVSIIIAKGGSIVNIYVGSMRADELDRFISSAL